MEKFFASITKIYAECDILPDINGHVTIPKNWTSIGEIIVRSYFRDYPVISIGMGHSVSAEALLQRLSLIALQALVWRHSLSAVV